MYSCISNSLFNKIKFAYMNLLTLKNFDLNFQSILSMKNGAGKKLVGKLRFTYKNI